MLETHASSTLALLGSIGTVELVVMSAIGLLIFGKRLPEVGKSIGQGIVQFKRGLTGIEAELENVAEPPAQIEQKRQRKKKGRTDASQSDEQL